MSIARSTLPLVCSLTVALAIAACGGEPTPTPSDPPALAEKPTAIVANADLASEKPTHFTLKGAIARHRDKLRDAPGRTGILAEQSRYSLFDEELIIRDFFQDREGGFFVDVGCAWPGKANNTYYLEKHLGWGGIGIDALAEYAQGWAIARPSSKFFNYLVTDHSDVKETFYRSENVGLSSAEKGQANGERFGGTLEVEEIATTTITLSDLLDREGIKKVDLLALDIEGYELPALRGFDIERFAPDLVVVEGKRKEVAAYFAEHGYVVIERYRVFDLVNEYFRPVSTNKTTD